MDLVLCTDLYDLSQVEYGVLYCPTSLGCAYYFIVFVYIEYLLRQTIVHVWAKSNCGMSW